MTDHLGEPSECEQCEFNPSLEEVILSRIVSLMDPLPFKAGQKRWIDPISGGQILLITDEGSNKVKRLQIHFGSRRINLDGQSIQQVFFKVPDENSNRPNKVNVVLQQQPPGQNPNEGWTKTQNFQKEALLSEVWIEIRKMLVKGVAVDQLAMDSDEVKDFSEEFRQRVLKALNMTGVYGKQIEARLAHDRLVKEIKVCFETVKIIPKQDSYDSGQSMQIKLSLEILRKIQNDIFWTKEDWEALFNNTIIRGQYGNGAEILAIIQEAISITVEFHPKGIVRTIESELPKGVTGFIGGQEGGKFIQAHHLVGIFSNQGATEQNEDGLLIHPEKGEYFLADGIGGGEEGEIFSKILLKTLVHNPHLTWKQRIALAADCAHRDQLDWSGGSTLAALKILEETDGHALVEFIHLGDSSIVAFGRNGVFYQSEPHIDMEQRINDPEWVKAEIERAFRNRVEGELTLEMQIEVLRLLITGQLGRLSRAFKRAIWDKFKPLKDDMEPTVVRRQMLKGTVVALLSDGCFITHYELMEIFNQAPFEKAYRNAMNLIMERQNTFAKLTGARERIPNESPHAILGPPDEQGMVPRVHLYKINGKGPLAPIDNHSGIFIQI